MSWYQVDRPGDDPEPTTDWSLFPQAYGILMNERLMFPEDLSLWKMKIDTRRQLFVDDHVLAHVENLKREFHSPRDHPANPILREGWPRYICPDPEHGYRMYYNSRGSYLRVAYSADGLNWEYPTLDLCDVKGDEAWEGSPDNVVMVGEIHGLFFEPEDPDPEQRWKAIVKKRDAAREVKWPYLKRELPEYTSCLCIRCEGVDLRIETPHHVAKLSEQMGQLESLTPKVAPGRPAVVDAWQRPR